MPGSVAAVFRSSLYVRFGEAWMCVGDRRIGCGPLNIPCSSPGLINWHHLARPGLMVTKQRDRIRFAEDTIVLTSAPVWAPEPLPTWTRTTLAAGLAELENVRPCELPTGGLAAFLHSGQGTSAVPSEPVSMVAAPAITMLSQWATADTQVRCPGQALRTLIGLGPGLTPSGDDFLAGFTVALNAAGQCEQAKALANEIDMLAADRTSDLSLAHLRASFSAGLNAALHGMLQATLAGKNSAIRSGVWHFADAKHHSLWDAMAGIAVALRAVLCRLAASTSASSR